MPRQRDHRASAAPSGVPGGKAARRAGTFRWPAALHGPDRLPGIAAKSMGQRGQWRNVGSLRSPRRPTHLGRGASSLVGSPSGAGNGLRVCTHSRTADGRETAIGTLDAEAVADPQHRPRPRAGEPPCVALRQPRRAAGAPNARQRRSQRSRLEAKFTGVDPLNGIRNQWIAPRPVALTSSERVPPRRRPRAPRCRPPRRGHPS